LVADNLVISSVLHAFITGCRQEEMPYCNFSPVAAGRLRRWSDEVYGIQERSIETGSLIDQAEYVYAIFFHHNLVFFHAVICTSHFSYLDISLNIFLILYYS